MTATDPLTPACPECGGTNTMVLSDGQARCFDDAHEWDPNTVHALPRAPQAVAPASDTLDVTDQPLPPTPELEPFGMMPADDVFGPEHELSPELFTERMADLIGGTARLEGGQDGVVMAFGNDERVLVRLGDGREEWVPIEDVEAILARAPVPEPEPPAVPDGIVVVAGEHVGMLSDMMIRMGIASIVERADGMEVGPPAVGWLPYDQELHALVEAAAAMTVARLVVAYGIDVEDLLEGLDRNEQTPDNGDHETETHDDAGTSNTD